MANQETTDDKRALLGALTLDDSQRESGGRTSRYLVTAVAAVILALVAWFFLLPDDTPVPVNVAVAENASGSLGQSTAAVLDASGYVTARRRATVSSKITGKVKEVFVEEGLVVKAGQLLATLDDSTQRANYALSQSQLAATRARLDEVRIQIQESELALGRTTELSQKNLASQSDMDTARLALQGGQARLIGLEREVDVASRSLELQQLMLDETQILAPFDGVVVTKAAQPGEMISPVSGGGGFTRTGICTLVDMNSLEVEVDVNEAYINRVKPGQPVTATLNAYQDWQIPAEVITIIPTADRNKATVRVRVGFKERDSRILPDMGVRVSFLEDAAPEVENEPVLTGVFIPGSAVTTVADDTVVYVVEGDRISVRKVRLGQRQGSRRNVVSGLKAGDRVVTGLTEELQTQLTDSQRVTVTDS